MLNASLQSSRGSGTDIESLRDLAQVRQFISSPLASALSDAPVAPFYLAIVYLIHPHLGWLSIGAGLLILLAALINQKLAKNPLAQAAKHSATALEKVRQLRGSR